MELNFWRVMLQLSDLFNMPPRSSRPVAPALDGSKPLFGNCATFIHAGSDCCFRRFELGADVLESLHPHRNPISVLRSTDEPGIPIRQNGSTAHFCQHVYRTALELLDPPLRHPHAPKNSLRFSGVPLDVALLVLRASRRDAKILMYQHTVATSPVKQYGGTARPHRVAQGSPRPYR